tara:strand:- start:1919 stop:2161 length:243 start_codon:yes stop_codon:yes gene_type:complete
MAEKNYYSRHQEARKDYQKQYYTNNKDRIRRKKMLEELEDPEKFESRKKYNQTYYEKNKERILKRRAKLYAEKKAAQNKP